MISWKFAVYFTRALYLLNLFCAVSCSGSFNYHALVLHENRMRYSSLDDPVKMRIYQEEIVPWLSQHLNSEEISSLNLERINYINRSFLELPDHFFKNSKLLFELTDLLIKNNFEDLAVEVIKFIRSNIHSFSSYSTVLEALSFEDLTVFHQILKLWFPGNVDKFALIQNLVDLRMGEDEVLEVIDILWEDLASTCSDDFMNLSVSKILLSAMRRHYVSVFEDILERRPKLIAFIGRKLELGGTIVHFFCRNLDSESLNRLRSKRFSKLFDVSLVDAMWLDHRSKSYPTANSDLLSIMKKFGADINRRDSRGMTPLHLAISLKNAHIVKVLLESGANHELPYKTKTVQQMAQFYEMDQVLNDYLNKK